MSTERAKRKLTAILSADVKDYSRLMGQDEPGTVALIKQYRSIFTQWVLEFRGRVVDAPGDNILAEFISAVDAVECALKIQEDLAIRNGSLPPDRRMEFRIGINLGDVIEDGNRIYGEGVNIAARVQSLAEGGAICISGTTYDQIANKLSLRFADLGEHRLKNIADPVRIYTVSKEFEKTGKPRKSKSRSAAWKLIVPVAAVLIVIAGFWTGINRKYPSPQHGHHTIAVLPFADMSPDKDQEYFADGLAEELLNILSQIPELQVVGRTSCFQFKGKNEDLRTIGRKLNASTILEGSVRKEGRHIRIAAQLINAANGFHLWSDTYNFEMEDVFKVQDEIARSVAEAMKVTLIGDKPSSPQTKNSEAYNDYLLGKYYAGRLTQADLAKAVEYYNQAIKLDSTYAPVWVGLGAVRLQQMDWGYLPTEEGCRAARDAANRALAINPRLGGAYSVLGLIKLSYDWDWAGADSAFKRSLELDPGDIRTRVNTSRLFAALGRFEESLSLLREAAQLDSLSLAAQGNYGIYAYFAGHLKLALTAIDRALELNHGVSCVHVYRGFIFLAEKKPQEALAEIRQESDPGWKLFGLAIVQYALGHKTASDSALVKLIEGYQSDSAFQIAQVYAYRAEKDLAFRWLEQAYSQHDPGLHFVKVEPMMANLKNDPRYAAFLKKMHLEN